MAGWQAIRRRVRGRLEARERATELRRRIILRGIVVQGETARPREVQEPRGKALRRQIRIWRAEDVTGVIFIKWFVNVKLV
jgi:hypothetical protein